MWKRTDDPQVPPSTTVADVPPTSTPIGTPQNTRSAARPAGQPARIGSSLTCEGKLNGDEDLVVDGRFRGEIQVPAHMVTIGSDVPASVTDRAGQVTLVMRRVRSPRYCATSRSSCAAPSSSRSARAWSVALSVTRSARVRLRPEMSEMRPTRSVNRATSTS